MILWCIFLRQGTNVPSLRRFGEEKNQPINSVLFLSWNNLNMWPTTGIDFKATSMQSVATGEVWDQDYGCTISLLSGTECMHSFFFSLFFLSLSSGSCLLSVWHRQLQFVSVESISPPPCQRRKIRYSVNRTTGIMLWVRDKSPSLTGFPDSGRHAELWSHVFMSPQLVERCFTSTETVRLLGTGAQDGHLDFHTAPELWTRRPKHDHVFVLCVQHDQWLDQSAGSADDAVVPAPARASHQPVLPAHSEPVWGVSSWCLA